MAADGARSFHRSRAGIPYSGMDTAMVPPRSAKVGEESGARPLLVSAHQAARLLGIGRTTLYELIKLGLVTPVHIGRCVRFSVTELEHYVEHLVARTSAAALPADPPSPTKACRTPTAVPVAATLF
jgi:excisionase family DNA binding protein